MFLKLWITILRYRTESSLTKIQIYRLCAQAQSLFYDIIYSCMKNIVAIIGSSSKHSSNARLVEHIVANTKDYCRFILWEDLTQFPHFSTDFTHNNAPPTIKKLYQTIEDADAVLISTPEYIFSIPSILKNILEWCVSTTVFSEKITAVITASADGRKGHEELILILKTLMADLHEETNLLIQGIKGKINENNIITDDKLKTELEKFLQTFRNRVGE